MKTDYSLAEFKTVYKTSDKLISQPVLAQASEVYKLLLKNWDLDTLDYQETFKVMFVNNSLRVIGIQTMSIGTQDTVTVDKRMLFATALSVGATGLVLAHNHPSGNLVASKTDKILTKQIKDICDLFAIRLIDHIILTSQGFYSMVNEGDL